MTFDDEIVVVNPTKSGKVYGLPGSVVIGVLQEYRHGVDGNKIGLKEILALQMLLYEELVWPHAGTVAYSVRLVPKSGDGATRAREVVPQAHKQGVVPQAHKQGIFFL